MRKCNTETLREQKIPLDTTDGGTATFNRVVRHIEETNNAVSMRHGIVSLKGKKYRVTSYRQVDGNYTKWALDDYCLQYNRHTSEFEYQQ